MPYGEIIQYQPGYDPTKNWAPDSPTSAPLSTKLDYCPLYNDIIAGTYSGNPDFETNGYADGCSGAVGNPYRVNNLTDYGRGVSCTKVGGTTNVITAIVQEDLVVGTDGIPKPQYCVRLCTMGAHARELTRMKEPRHAKPAVAPNGQLFAVRLGRINDVVGEPHEL